MIGESLAKNFERGGCFGWCVIVGHPAISQAGGAAQGWFRMPTEPERDRSLNGKWVDAGIRDGVIASLEFDKRLCPKEAHHFDLLFEAPAAVMKILVQGLIFDPIPASTDSDFAGAHH